MRNTVDGAIAVTLVAAAGVCPAAEKVLYDFTPGFDLTGVITTDVALSVSVPGSLRIESGHREKWPGITLRAPAGGWDLSDCGVLSMDVRNAGTTSVDVGLRADDADADAGK